MIPDFVPKSFSHREWLFFRTERNFLSVLVFQPEATFGDKQSSSVWRHDRIGGYAGESRVVTNVIDRGTGEADTPDGTAATSSQTSPGDWFWPQFAISKLSC